MTVDLAKAAATVEQNGTRYFFCSQGCAAKFRAEPQKYLEKKEVAPGPLVPPTKAQPGTEYICPMDPEVHQMGPGACPKCGMALEPATITAPATRTDFTCPMHPQISRQEPGNCPICGMTLEPRETTVEEINPELEGHDTALLDQRCSFRSTTCAHGFGNPAFHAPPAPAFGQNLGHH